MELQSEESERIATLTASAIKASGDIYDEDLLMEAARYAIDRGVHRNRFMGQAKRAWVIADAEARGRRWAEERIKATQSKAGVAG